MNFFKLTKNAHVWFMEEYGKGAIELITDNNKVTFVYKGQIISDEGSRVETLIKMYKLYGGQN